MWNCKNLTAAALAALVTIALTACGGQQPGPEPQVAQVPPTATPFPTPTNTPPPTPTRPQRLTFQPTQEAAQSQTSTTDQLQEAPESRVIPKETTQPQQEPPVTPTRVPQNLKLEDLVPDNPLTEETVLLQDIYDRMDLDQFALDPNSPIQIPGRRNPKSIEAANDNQDFDGTQAQDHPYSFLTEPHGYYLPKRIDEFTPIRHFIYNPWFERMQTRVGARRDSPTALEARDYFATYYKQEKGYGPNWFGNRSTRGTILNALAKSFEEAKLPGTRSKPLSWPTKRTPFLSETIVESEERDWTIKDYLATRINSREHLDNRRFAGKHYQAPAVNFDFVHPTLPIIRIRTANKVNFPLIANGRTQTTPTEYSVSFVISFQNRWASLEDPNRWVIRFQDAMPLWRNRTLYQQLNYPETVPTDQWHTTDFMQHRLIGPIVLQIHESDVFQVGNYAIIPETAYWPAPGYIASDEQLKWPRRLFSTQANEADQDQAKARKEREQEFLQDIEGKILDLETRTSTREVPGAGFILTIYEYFTDDFTASPSRETSPNPNWPLPGHVLTSPSTGPGTDVWKEYGMDDQDW